MNVKHKDISRIINMKLILVQHGETFDSMLYFTPLTEKGFDQSNKLVEKLSSYDIDAIYSSPFLSTLQTIYPYCQANNKTVKVENTFYECLTSPVFNHKNYRHRPAELQKSWPHLGLIVERYQSKVFVSNINYMETHQDVLNRVFPFIHNLKKEDKTVLIITHRIIINAIKKYFDSSVSMEDDIGKATPFIIDL